MPEWSPASDTSVAQASPPRETPEEKFARLAEQWRAETGMLSSLNEMAMHPAYQQIIGMGETAVPLLLRELARTPDHWFWALRAITGADPVPAADRGKLPRMAEAWLKWGKTIEAPESSA